jgi:hypothetical protein
MKRLAMLLLALSACAQPGQEVRPEATDFAFIQTHLKG